MMSDHITKPYSCIKNMSRAALPRRSLQCFSVLRFLKIPPELLEEKAAPGKKALRIAGWSLGGATLGAVIYMLFVQ
jgi:hypothetical protein